MEKELLTVGNSFSERKWIQGTTGNFSATVSREPFKLVITRSGADRRALRSSDFVYLSKSGQSLDDRQVPVETPIHLAIISNSGAGAVLQTHSVWSSVLAEVYTASGGVELEGFEPLRGLSPIGACRHVQWVPILESSGNYPTLVGAIDRLTKNHPGIHAILLRKHGLYTWGKSVKDAVRNVEIFEFLFEVVVRQLHILGETDLTVQSGSLT